MVLTALLLVFPVEILRFWRYFVWKVHSLKFLFFSLEKKEKEIFKDTSDTIHTALEKTHEVNEDKTGIAKAAFEIALKKLV